MGRPKGSKNKNPKLKPKKPEPPLGIDTIGSDFKSVRYWIDQVDGEYRVWRAKRKTKNKWLEPYLLQKAKCEVELFLKEDGRVGCRLKEEVKGESIDLINSSDRSAVEVLF